jgi:hypothetical protein
VPRWYYTYKEQFKKEVTNNIEENFSNKNYYILKDGEYIPAEYFV